MWWPLPYFTVCASGSKLSQNDSRRPSSYPAHSQTVHKQGVLIHMFQPACLTHCSASHYGALLTLLVALSRSH